MSRRSRKLVCRVCLQPAALALIALVLLPRPTACQAGQKPAEKEPAKWTSLFDGKTLSGWKKTAFGGEGDVYVQDGYIVVEFGSSMSGITYDKKDFPKTNYEISLEAKRIDGTDFFCGLTFPVGKDYCSLILGGWGGAVVGLSSIDDEDASENATNRLISFKKNRWYRTRVRVTESDISVWLDGKKIITQDIANHKISIRPEVDLSRPLGISTWDTKAGIKNVRWRKLK